MGDNEINFDNVHPIFPDSKVHYSMGVDFKGKLRERVQASIWKLNTDGTLERLKYSVDILGGDSADDQ